MQCSLIPGSIKVMGSHHNNKGRNKGQELAAPEAPEVLTDPNRTRSDCRLAARAIKERWAVSPTAKTAIVERLTEIVEKRSVTVTSREGNVEECEDTADMHAIAASRVLVAIVGQNQADEHLQLKAEMAEDSAKSSGDTYNIGVVGSMMHGGEPVSIDQARAQAIEAVAKLMDRTTTPDRVPPAQAASPQTDSLERHGAGLEDI